MSEEIKSDKKEVVREGDFSLTVTFTDKGRSPHSIPQEVLDRLDTDVAKLMVAFFQADDYKKSGMTAKKAYDSYRSNQYPGHPYQLALEAAEALILANLKNDFGPTAAKSLHPWPHFTKIEPE